MGKDTKLYDALGVSPDASDEAIKRAYKKLAAKHHPDRKGGDVERFKEIGAAYEVLGDPDKRKLYDEFGDVALQSGFDPEAARAYTGGGESPFGGGFDSGGLDLEDLLRGIGGFGGGSPFDGGRPFDDVFGGGRHTSPSGSLRGQDVHAVVELDLARAIRGTQIALEVPTAESCSHCRGTGETGQASAGACPDCGGSGQRQVNRGNVRMVASCTRCGGLGRQVTPCPKCHGAGQKRRHRKLNVRIPPGADDGSTIRLRGKGHPGPGGGRAGDLVIETKVQPHPRVRRDGLDLYMSVPVTLEEAYVGAEIEVPTFEGPVKLRVPAGSQSGTKLRLRGRGVARGKERGDFYVELDVRLPEAGNAQLAKALRGVTYEQPVRADLSL